MTRVLILILAGALGACAAPSATLMDGRSADDAVRLTNGDVVRGRIVDDDGRQIVLERDDRIVTVPRATVHSVEYSKDSYRERSLPLRPAEASPDAVRPSSTWMPRAHPGERVEAHEVLWFDGHATADCLGTDLFKAHEDLPDLALFAEAGGRLVLHDPKKWGYHAHVQPSGFHRPGAAPGLVLPMPAGDAALPTAVTFVSPSQEVKSAEIAERGSYALPDAVHAVVRPLGEAEATLAAQPFSGGRPAATRHGALWAFALPRNARQFLVVLLDGRRKHGEILKASFVAVGGTILAPDLMVDSVAADGTVVGRAFVVPFPDGIPADGPAPEPVAVYAGPVQDPALVVTMPLPPRHSIQIPARAAATKAAVLVSAFDVSKSLPQSMVLAWGVGRPTRDVTLSVRELSPGDADPIVKIDLASLPEERFPAVAWIYERRSYVWRSTGGRLPAVEPLVRAPARDPGTPDRVKQSQPIPHVIPLLFQGPKPGAALPGAEPAVKVSGGMSSAFLADSLMREAGTLAAGAPLQNPAPAPVSGGSYSNVTNLTIVVPPHEGAGGLGAVAPTAMPDRRFPPSGLYLNRTPGWGSEVGPLFGRNTMGPLRGFTEDGVFTSTGGSVMYDPSSGTAMPRSR